VSPCFKTRSLSIAERERTCRCREERVCRDPSARLGSSLPVTKRVKPCIVIRSTRRLFVRVLDFRFVVKTDDSHVYQCQSADRFLTLSSMSALVFSRQLRANFIFARDSGH
jgi:hypothetical protein